MNNFYTSGEGKRWRVPDTRFCSPGQLLAAKYSEIGYHRILVEHIINYEKVSVLYVDYGTIMEIHASDLRLLHKKFLKLPAQAVKAWGHILIIQWKRELNSLCKQGIFEL